MSAPNTIIQSIEQDYLREAGLPEFRPGDTVKVWVKIREGEKTRLQAFEGVCIKRARGGPRASFTVRKVSYGVGVERLFPEASPNVDRVEVLAHGRVRRSRLYYLRDRSGKAARIRERVWDRTRSDELADAQDGKTARKKARLEARAKSKAERSDKKKAKAPAKVEDAGEPGAAPAAE